MGPCWFDLCFSVSLFLSLSRSLSPSLYLTLRLSDSLGAPRSPLLSLSLSLFRGLPLRQIHPQRLPKPWASATHGPHVATSLAMRMSQRNPHCILNMRIHATLPFEHANTCICFFIKSIGRTPTGGKQRSSTHQACTELRDIT